MMTTQPVIDVVIVLPFATCEQYCQYVNIWSLTLDEDGFGLEIC